MKSKSQSFLTPAKIVVFLSIIISLIGLLFVFEASVAESYNIFSQPYHFVQQQAVWLLVGLGIMTIAFMFPLPLLQKMAPFIYGLNLILLLLVFIPGIGMELNGAHRWFVIGGMVFQPVEILKFSMVIFFASWMSKHQRLMPFLFLTLIPTILVLLQPDLGSVLIVLCIAFGMYFLAGGNLKHLTVLGIFGIGIIFLLILTQPYRLRRLTTFTNPDLDPLGASFHIRQITIALGNGGWLGQGIGKSKQKFSYIPEASSDSIFAIVAEEIGFLGSAVLLLLFLGYLHAGYRILKKLKPASFEYLLAAGILIWISAQIFLNLAAVVALVPLTGVPLPFFSYGGSSLVMVLCATAVLAKTFSKTS